MIFNTYDIDGNTIEIEATPIFTSLERSPTLTAFPGNLIGITVSIPALDGKPRLAFLPLSLFAKGVDMTQVQKDLTEKPDWAALPNVTLYEKTLVARVAGVSSLEVDCLGAQVGDVLTVTPVGKMTAGYMLGAATCEVAGTIQVPVFHPAQAEQVEFNFTVKVYALRTNVKG